MVNFVTLSRYEETINVTYNNVLTYSQKGDHWLSFQLTSNWTCLFTAIPRTERPALKATKHFPIMWIAPQTNPTYVNKSLRHSQYCDKQLNPSFAKVWNFNISIISLRFFFPFVHFYVISCLLQGILKLKSRCVTFARLVGAIRWN